MVIDFSNSAIDDSIFTYPEWTQEGVPQAPEQREFVTGNAGNVLNVEGTVSSAIVPRLS